MLQRLLNPLKSGSFFIFGARGTGKSTFLHSFLKPYKHLYLDLLDDQTFDQYFRHPELLEEHCAHKKYQWIAIDEVQKLPQLLNTAHRMIEKYHQKFILTGSSARKLKRGGANLLAGRA